MADDAACAQCTAPHQLSDRGAGVKAYLVTIRPVGRAPWCYSGIFAHSVDALLHGLDISADPRAVVSARPLERAA